jgi:hypothetical protein
MRARERVVERGGEREGEAGWTGIQARLRREEIDASKGG